MPTDPTGRQIDPTTGQPIPTNPAPAPPAAAPSIPNGISALTNYGLPIAATIYGGLTQANAYTDAGQTAADAARGAGAQVNQAATTAAQGFDPYAAAGTKALNNLSNSNFSFNGSDLTSDPGYQFRLAQGQKALMNSLAAKGNALGGAAIKEGEQYNQGFASNEFQNAYNRAQQTYQTNLGQQQNLANLGFSGQQQQGIFNTQGATYQGNANTQAGNDIAQGGIGAGNSKAIMANQIANILLRNNSPGAPSLASLITSALHG